MPPVVGLRYLPVGSHRTVVIGSHGSRLCGADTSAAWNPVATLRPCGQVRLPAIHNPLGPLTALLRGQLSDSAHFLEPACHNSPGPLTALLRGQRPASAHFLEHNREDSMCLQPACTVARLHTLDAPAVQSLPIHGQVYFNIGPL